MKRMNLCIFNHLKLKVLVFRVSQFWYRGKARMKRMKVALQRLSEEESLPSYDDIQPLETQGHFFIFLFSFAGFFIYSTHRQSLSPWDVVSSRQVCEESRGNEHAARLKMEQRHNLDQGDGMTSIEPSAGNINDVCEKSMADPFAYEAYRKIKKRIQEKIEAERTNRIMV
ncbi:hypothetical protein SUGI_1014550 [Cryptomeria japonica]|nr:hypothetical protein SUGI_1014550 [Cryptomeria japonica]